MTSDTRINFYTSGTEPINIDNPTAEDVVDIMENYHPTKVFCHDDNKRACFSQLKEYAKQLASEDSRLDEYRSNEFIIKVGFNLNEHRYDLPFLPKLHKFLSFGSYNEINYDYESGNCAYSAGSVDVAVFDNYGKSLDKMYDIDINYEGDENYNKWPLCESIPEDIRVQLFEILQFTNNKYYNAPDNFSVRTIGDMRKVYLRPF